MNFETYGRVERIHNLTLVNADCMQILKDLPDNYYDLACVDPPYGIGIAQERERKDGRFAGNIPKNWDDYTPDEEYFNELKRVSENQIIWGGNYYPQLWLNGCKGFIFWWKKQPVDNFSDGEFAYTSFNRPAKCFPFAYYGGLQGQTKAEKRIHISQKPIELYEWLLTNYAKPDQKILDTHLGSGSSTIAAHYFGCEFTGVEIDKDYFNASIERITEQTKQVDLFA